MASIFNNKKSGFGVEIVVNKKRWRFWGFPRRSDALKFKEKLEELQAYKRSGLDLPASLVTWLDNLWNNNPFQYRRLVEIDFADFREECGNIGELIERYHTYAVNGQEPKNRTVLNRRTASNSFLYFLANQRMGNFRRDERALRVASTIHVKEITVDVAEKYYAELKKTYQPSTWGRRIKHFKTMFDLAVSIGWISKNPFEKLRGSSPANKSRNSNVKPELAQQVLDACPNTRLKLAFSFGRWGGLRMPSEIVFMRWSDILWSENKIRICIPKKTTKTDQENGNFKTRFIPLFPEIRVALEAYRADLKKTGEFTGEDGLIFPEMEDSERAGALFRKQFRQVLKNAGIEEWSKLFMSLRATRDAELQNIYPIHLVCEWMGHSPEISLKHYTQSTPEDFRQASNNEKPLP